MECDKLTLVLEEELQDQTLVKKNDFAIDEKPSLKEKQVEKRTFDSCHSRGSGINKIYT